jgi:hypothetical protein
VRADEIDVFSPPTYLDGPVAPGGITLAPGGDVVDRAPGPRLRGGSTPSAAAAAPSSAPSSSTLITFSGSGIRNSAPFVVNSSTVTAHYSYDCSAVGTGNFIADLVSGSPSSGSYDDESIANELSSGGSQTTTVYPANQGGSYHLAVNSGCSWSITLTSG